MSGAVYEARLSRDVQQALLGCELRIANAAEEYVSER